jgi:hypothetical protein
MDEPPSLRDNRHWRLAVWALRVGCVGVAVGITGLVVLAFGFTPWVLATGVIIWLVAAAVTLTGSSGPGTTFTSHDAGTGRCGSCSSTTLSTTARRLIDPEGRSASLHRHLLSHLARRRGNVFFGHRQHQVVLA